MDIQTLAAAIAVAKKLNSTPEYVTAAVEAWLSEHVDPSTGYVLDDTLSVEGAAADAKKAGDLLSDVKSQIETVEDEVADIDSLIRRRVVGKNMINTDALTIGQLSSNGTVDTSKTSYKTSDYIFLEGGKSYIFARERLSAAEGAAMSYSGYGVYDLSKTWVPNSRVWGNNTAAGLTISPATDCYIRVGGAQNYFTDDTNALYILQEGTSLDGWEAYFEPYYEVLVVEKNDIVQESGQATDKVMSQKAVTEVVPEIVDENLADFAPLTIGKNKYDKMTAGAQNSMYYNSTTGAVVAADSYAISGKIPVEAQTQYTVSGTEFSLIYSRIYYFGGVDGSTYLGRTDSSGILTVTTPENCTFIAIQYFGRTHTAEDFTAAINATQVELGATPTSYAPYSKKRMVSPDNIVGGEDIAAIGEVTETASLINLYDKALAEDGKYYNRGVVASNADWAITGKIPVKPNTQYNLSRDPSTPLPLSSAIYTYDASGTYLGTAATLSNYVYDYLLAFFTGPDVYFISCNMSLQGHSAQDFSDTIDTLMLCYGTARPKQYAAYNPEVFTIAAKNSDTYFNPDVFTGKRWLATGTSITWYDSKTYQAGLHTGEICRGYVGAVARRKALLVTNEGISGSTLANVSSSSLINRYQDLDWANADIATIEYGVNDFGNAVDIGTADDAPGTDTFAACLKTVIEYALTQNPKLCLVICTEPDVRGNTQNTSGHYLKEYTDVTLEIAKQYRLPVCDWYYHCGINAVTKGNGSTDLLTADGTHPNDAGHLRMGAMLNQVFDSLIC